MNLHLQLFCISLLVFLGGCDSGIKTVNGEDDLEMVQELGFKPSERWTKLGDYSYEFNINGCRTGFHSFKDQKNYCIALMNSVMNNVCALELRMNTFEVDCGEGFQQLYIPAPAVIKGHDRHLGRYCETAKPTEQIFEFLSGVCGFLKNESLHKGCHWATRFERFEALSCRGSFSREP
jgi:hypothetical protein